MWPTRSAIWCPTVPFESCPQDGDEAYRITDSGRSSAALLETTLPFSVREKAVKSAARLLAKHRNERENRVVSERVEGGFMVSCSVLDHDLELMTVRLLVSDEMQVAAIAGNLSALPSKGISVGTFPHNWENENLFGAAAEADESAL